MGDIHMGGLVSGTDVQGIIDQLLELEISKIKTVQTKQLEFEADISAWGTISADMTALTDSLYQLKSSDTWNGTTSASSDETKLATSSTASAIAATYNVTITKLATSHIIASDKASVLTGNSDDDADTDLVAAGILTAGETFTIEGQTVTIAADESLNSLVGQINTAAESMDAADRVSATIIDNTLVVSRDNTGNTDITLTDSSGTPLADIGLLAAGVPNHELSASQDAEFTINGIDVTRASNIGITDVIAGVSLTLVGEADAADNLNLTISSDTATPKAAIQEFITNYNTAVSQMESFTEVNLSDPAHPSVAILQGDTLISSMLFKLRQLATDMKSDYLTDANAAYTYGGATGVADSLEDIGVWTSDRSNQLSITDETKLDFMLENSFEVVEQMFRGVFEEANGYVHGVAEDLHDYSYGMSASMTGTIATRITRLEDEITDSEARVEDMYNKLDQYESKLWADFSAMEDAIAQMQQELSWLTSQLGVSK